MHYMYVYKAGGGGDRFTAASDRSSSNLSPEVYKTENKSQIGFTF